MRWLIRWLSPRRRAIRAADGARDSGNALDAANRYGAILARWGPQSGLLVQYGNALKDAGLFLDADATYRSAQEREPDNAEIFLQRGHLAKITGNIDDAYDLYSSAWNINPDLSGLAEELPRRKLRRRHHASEPRDHATAAQLFVAWLDDINDIDQPQRNAFTYRQTVMQLAAATAR